MKKLRYISIRTMMRYESFSGDIDYLSNQLRWLDWPYCPLQCLPSNFHAKKLVNLNIYRSCRITRLWEGHKNFPRLTWMNLSGCESLKELPHLSEIPNLKELNLSGCESLKELPDLSEIPNLKELNLSGCESLNELPDLSGIPNLKELNLSGCTSLKELPDFSGIPNLEELDLSKCTSLVKIPDSVGLLDKLVTLNVDYCDNLIMFPRKINLKSVETISMMFSKLKEFSEVGEEMVSLRKLNLAATRIKELHPSITKLIGLEELILGACENLTTLPYNIYELHNLKILFATGCFKLATFPEIPIKMDSLRDLHLPRSGIRELDESIKNLIGLQRLDLRCCKNLTTLPCNIYGLQNLVDLDLSGCSKLVRFPTNTKILNVDGCSLSLPKLDYLNIAGCSLLSDCDFLMTLDCWETLEWLNLSRNNFVSLPACLTKFVKLQMLDLSGCKRLRGIPEIPPNVKPKIRGCESLEERSSTLTDPGAVIEAASPSIEEPTPSSWLSLSSETPKRHRSAEEPSPTPVNPPKRQRTAAGGQAPVVPMFPDHHSTTSPQLQHQDESTELLRLSLLRLSLS
ncbi:disease resistance protein TAO1-like [Rosa rugosa]|uniref:disease resistance protein TAO1-like n=1 Tax=Rosa rugosa TaxID=74645 RepID=UPI002B4181AB|nr:disease resistance protein TAO1-like [Rosa rugosa]